MIVLYPDGRRFLTVAEIEAERLRAEQRAETAEERAETAEQRAETAEQRADQFRQRLERLQELSRKVRQRQASTEELRELERLEGESLAK